MRKQNTFSLEVTEDNSWYVLENTKLGEVVTTSSGTFQLRGIRGSRINGAKKLRLLYVEMEEKIND